jgi:hypothetical protein
MPKNQGKSGTPQLVKLSYMQVQLKDVSFVDLVQVILPLNNNGIDPTHESFSLELSCEAGSGLVPLFGKRIICLLKENIDDSGARTDM